MQIARYFGERSGRRGGIIALSRTVGSIAEQTDSPEIFRYIYTYIFYYTWNSLQLTCIPHFEFRICTMISASYFRLSHQITPNYYFQFHFILLLIFLRYSIYISYLYLKIEHSKLKLFCMNLY